MTVFAVHPDPELSDIQAVQITDIDSEREFTARWEDENDNVQEEFGWDSPLFERDVDIPARRIPMLYREYIRLVDDVSCFSDEGVEAL